MFLTAVLFLVGCSHPATTPMTFDTAADAANNGQMVSIEGYARLPVSGIINDTMLIDLHQTADEKSPHIGIDVPIGSGANHLEEPPKDYKDSDMKLHASDGSLIAPTDKVRVSGELNVQQADKTKVIWLDKIFAIEKVK